MKDRVASLKSSLSAASRCMAAIRASFAPDELKARLVQRVGG